MGCSRDGVGVTADIYVYKIDIQVSRGESGRVAMSLAVIEGRFGKGAPLPSTASTSAPCGPR